MTTSTLDRTLEPSRIVAAATVGDYAPLDEFAREISESALMGDGWTGRSVHFPTLRVAVADALSVAARAGRFDVCDAAFQRIPQLRDDIVAKLSQAWTYYEFSAREIVRRYGLTKEAIDSVLSVVNVIDCAIPREVLLELVLVQRPSSVPAAALFASAAKHTCMRSGCTTLSTDMVSEDVLLNRWGFLLPYVDTQDGVNRLRKVLITEGLDSLLARTMSLLPSSEIDLDKDIDTAAAKGNLEALRCLCDLRPNRSVLLSAIGTASRSGHGDCARFLHAQAGSPSVDRFIPAMIDGITPPGVDFNPTTARPIPLDCSRVKEDTILRLMQAESRRHDVNGLAFLFNAGVKPTRTIATTLLAAIVEMRKNGITNGSNEFNFGKDLGPGARLLVSLFGAGGVGFGLLFAEDVRNRRLMLDGHLRSPAAWDTLIAALPAQPAAVKP